METEARTIPGHREYTISPSGEVRRVINAKRTNGQPLKHSMQTIKGKETGYHYVTLISYDIKLPDGEVTDGYKFIRVAVHKLTAMTFIGPQPKGKPWINHKDGNKHNNHYSNLEWDSISHNIQHAYDTGLKIAPTGADHWNHGKEVSQDTRSLMADAKVGENHPKFKGWYTFNGKRYASARQASIATRVDQRKIKHLVFDKSSGWAFEPKAV